MKSALLRTAVLTLAFVFGMFVQWTIMEAVNIPRAHREAYQAGINCGMPAGAEYALEHRADPFSTAGLPALYIGVNARRAARYPQWPELELDATGTVVKK